MTAKTKKWLLTCFCLLLVSFLLIGSTITASAVAYLPFTLTITNTNNNPNEVLDLYTWQNGAPQTTDAFGSHTINNYYGEQLYTVGTDSGGKYIQFSGTKNYFYMSTTPIPDGQYRYICIVTNTQADYCLDLFSRSYVGLVNNTNLHEVFVLCDGASLTLDYVDSDGLTVYPQTYTFLVPYTATEPDPTCPTLEELIAGYNGSWGDFDRLLQANNPQLYNEYILTLYAWLEDGEDIGYELGFDEGFAEGHTEGFTEGFNLGLNGLVTDDPIDQYWNSTKDTILIAGAPYFMPNGFGSIDATNTVGIYGLQTSYVQRLDGTQQAFQGQYVTEFATSGTLTGGWYKIGGTVGDPNAYEQTLTTAPVHDKAYYVAEFDENGTPIAHHLIAIWLDGYEAWFVAEEYAHHGTVADGNKDYKQVYSIYLTDIPPTSQMFVNYDNLTTNEFREDRGATLRLATFNQLNNYNIYTFNTNAVEQYHNGFDSGANTTLWLNLLSQPIVAFFSIPLAQVIVEGVTYTLTYGIVLGAGIGALILIWFLKLFAGG